MLAPIECPISRVMHEMKSGGEAQESDAAIVVVGGTEIVCDVAEYALSILRIEAARFEARNAQKEPEEMKQLCSEFAARHVASDYAELYDILYPQILGENLVAAQFWEVIRCIVALSRALPAGNITLPDIDIVERASFLLPRRPDILTYQMEQIGGFISRLNVDAVLLVPLTKPKFVTWKPVMFENVEIDGKCETMAELLVLIGHKVKVLEFMREIEAAHCLAIRYMEEVKIYLMKCANNFI